MINYVIIHSNRMNLSNIFPASTNTNNRTIVKNIGPHMKITIEYNLYEIRNSKHLTIRKLSMLSGVSKSMINNIENNKGNPTVMTMCQLAVALEVKPSDMYRYHVN